MTEPDEQRPDPAPGAGHTPAGPDQNGPVEPAGAAAPRVPAPGEGQGAERAGSEAVLPSTEASGAEGVEPAEAEPTAVEPAVLEPVDPEPGAPEPTASEPVAEAPVTGRRAGRKAADRPAPGPDDPGFDEEAAWQAIIAGYGAEPPDPPGARPFRSVENLALLEPDPDGDVDDWDGTGGRPGKRGAADRPKSDDDTEGDADRTDGPAGGPTRPLGGSVVFAPGVGPRDYTPSSPSDDDFDEDDEGHFVPPEPPPLPAAEPTAKFAWLGVLGGPLLMLLAVLLGWQMTWWLTALGIGGLVGGFVTLVIRMNPGDEDDDDPGRGAVV